MSLVKICVQVPIRGMKRNKDGRYFKDPVQSISDVISFYSSKGVGVVGNYDNVSFTLEKGAGRYRAIPGSSAIPSAGEIGRQHKEPEMMILFNSPKDVLKELLKDIKKNHVYEEPVIDVYRLEDIGVEEDSV